MTEKVKIKPEVDLDIGGGIRKLILDHNSIYALEETEGPVYITEVVSKLGTSGLGVRDTIVLLWACLLTSIPELDVRKEDDLRMARRQVALWLTDAKVKAKAQTALMTAMLNSTVIPRDDNGEIVSSKKANPSPETGSEK
jgi:hypothetical protein